MASLARRMVERSGLSPRSWCRTTCRLRVAAATADASRSDARKSSLTLPPPCAWRPFSLPRPDRHHLMGGFLCSRRRCNSSRLQAGGIHDSDCVPDGIGYRTGTHAYVVGSRSIESRLPRVGKGCSNAVAAGRDGRGREVHVTHAKHRRGRARRSARIFIKGLTRFALVRRDACCAGVHQSQRHRALLARIR